MSKLTICGGGNAAHVLFALPAFAHGNTLRAIAPHLEPGAAVGALPARSGFDFQARAICHQQPTSRLFGLQTLPWACRITTFGRAVEVLGTKADLPQTRAPQIYGINKLTGLVNP